MCNRINALRVKKIIAAVVISFGLFTSANAGTTGVGFAIDMGVGFAAQIDGKINLSLGSSGFAADYLLMDTKIDADFNTDVINKISWYVGAGAGYHWAKWGDAKVGDVDFRVPVGVDLHFAKVFDVYLQVAPSLRIGDSTGIGTSGAIGVRYFY